MAPSSEPAWLGVGQCKTFLVDGVSLLGSIALPSILQRKNTLRYLSNSVQVSSLGFGSAVTVEVPTDPTHSPDRGILHSPLPKK